jgi:ATP-dependent Clp protease, protease subunit
MARDETAKAAPPEVLSRPQISLVGEIDKFAVERFLDQLRGAERAGGEIALELTTLGGDPEMARRIVLEIEDARARIGGRFLFLGKTVVYSAGTTIMSAFPRGDRWLARDAMLMIHCRKLDKTVEIAGPLRSSLPQVEALASQMKTGLALEEENFHRLIEGSGIGFDELASKALCNWYLTAREALERGLVAGIV